MSDDKKCNGWANYETWLCNLWFDDWSDFASEYENVSDLADGMKNYVEEVIEQDVQTKNGFINDLINAAVSEVDWYEIAEHYEEDLKKVDTEETEEEEA